jgi:multidrug resistance efflux pump
LLVGVAADRLVAVLRDNRTGQVRALSVYTFERGDDLTFALHPRLAATGQVAAGDTVGWLRSAALDLQLAHLQAELASAQALLQVEQSGQKEAVVQTARQQLAAAEELVAQQQKRRDRQRELFAAGLASAEELEEADNLLALYTIQAGIAQAELQTARTGSSQANVDLAHTRLDGLRRELELRQRQQAARTLVAPFSGLVAGTTSVDTLLVLKEDAAPVAQLLVDWQDLERLDPGQPVTLEIGGQRRPLTGAIARISPQIHPFNGRQVLVAVAELEMEDQNLRPGLMMRGVISLRPVFLRQYLWDFLER